MKQEKQIDKEKKRQLFHLRKKTLTPENELNRHIVK